MKRIGIYTTEPDDGCAFYRSVGPLQQLRRHGIDVEIADKKVSWSTLARYDVVFMQRPHSAQHLQVAEFVASVKPLWVDYDDALPYIPPSNPAYFDFTGQAVAGRMAECCKFASRVTVSTPKMAEIITKISGVESIVIPNAYDDYAYPTDAPQPSRYKRVLWRGTNSHQGDLLHHAEALKRIIEAHTDWEFIFLGMPPWMLSLERENNVRVHAPIPLTLYYRTLREQIRPDVVIVPLVTNAFNRAKSNIAIIEGASAGAQMVVPAWPEWLVPGVSGYGPYDFERVCAAALANDNPSGDTWEWVQKERFLSKINELRLKIFEELTS